MSSELFQNTISPIDNTIIVSRKFSNEFEINEALSKSFKSFNEWKLTTLEYRKKILKKSLELFEKNSDNFPEELARTIGRPVRFGKNEIKGYLERGNALLDIAELALKDIPIPENYGNKSSDKTTRFIRKEPLGVVFVISAWNYPYLISINSIFPALLAGNSVILKHSAQTPLAAERILESLNLAGLPGGVFQVLNLTHAQTENLIKRNDQNGSIVFVNFTGSVEGGHSVTKASSDRFIGLGLELGGCDAAYVREDADVSFSAAELVDGAFYNAGQSCCGIQRIFVAEKVFEKFVQEFKNLTMENYGSLGNPLDATTTVGPVVRVSAADWVRKSKEHDLAEGAKEIAFPSSPLDKNGSSYLFPIALIVPENLPMKNFKVMTEELFGPIVGIRSVKNDEEAISLINESEYGLTASLWSQDTNYCFRELIPKVNAGTVFVNKCDYLDPYLPWSGVKNSGKGVSLSALGFDQLTQTKSIYVFKP